MSDRPPTYRLPLGGRYVDAGAANRRVRVCVPQRAYRQEGHDLKSCMYWRIVRFGYWRTEVKTLRSNLAKLVIGLTVVGATLTPTIASADTAAPLGSTCTLMAATVLEDNDVDPAGASYDYVCTPGVVAVEIAQPDGSTSTLSEDASDVVAELPPGSDAHERVATCNIFGAPTRTIVSELQVNIDACVGYGQNNHPQNGSWLRTAKIEWTAYPAYPSVQNNLRLISTEAANGDVWLFGTLTLQKQNGIGVPIDISSSVFDIRSGEPPVPAAYLYGSVQWGSHAIRLDDLSITDFDYQFSAQVSDPTLYTPRFHCDTNVNRCYYPNGEEAGL